MVMVDGDGDGDGVGDEIMHHAMREKESQTDTLLISLCFLFLLTIMRPRLQHKKEVPFKYQRTGDDAGRWIKMLLENCDEKDGETKYTYDGFNNRQLLIPIKNSVRW